MQKMLTKKNTKKNKKFSWFLANSCCFETCFHDFHLPTYLKEGTYKSFNWKLVETN